MRPEPILLYIDAGRLVKTRRPNAIRDLSKFRAAHILHRWRGQRLPIIYLALATSLPRKHYRRDLLRATPTDILIDHHVHSSLSENRKFVDLLGDWDVDEIALIGGSLDGVVLRTILEDTLSHYRWTIVRDATWIDRSATTSAASVRAVTEALLMPHAAFISSRDLLDRLQVDASL